MTLSEKLKQETKTEHQLLEKAMIPLLRNANSVEKYTQILYLFYSFFNQAESHLSNLNLSDEEVPFLEKRRKSEWILRELASLKQSPPPTIISSAEGFPEIKTISEAFGLLYVLEGSTLGGQHIVKMLQQTVPASNHQFLFFNGYGSDTMLMWTSFVTAMNSLSLDTEQVVHKAAEVFRAFHRYTVSASL